MNDWEILSNPEQWIIVLASIVLTLVIEHLVNKLFGRLSKKRAATNEKKNEARRALIEELAGSPAYLRLYWLETGMIGLVQALCAVSWVMCMVISASESPPLLALFFLFGFLSMTVVMLSGFSVIWKRLRLLSRVYILLLREEAAMKQTASGEKEGDSGEA